MKFSAIKLFLLMLGTVLLISACGLGAGSNTGSEPSDVPPPAQEPEQQLIMAKGEIISIYNSSVLITAYIDKGENAYIDAFSLILTDQTELLHADGSAADASELVPGAQVEAWSSGPVQESYPGRANAAKLILQTETKPEGGISRSEAVRIALEAQTELAWPWGVKAAELDEDSQFWRIELIHHQYIDQPVNVRINAGTGEITSIPVVENETFRIFTPMPDEVLGNVFVVEGEARVFEGAFSWSLEDGHQVLAQGEALAEESAPEWGKFKIEVSFEYAVQPSMVLVLSVRSAKDGTEQHTLAIPLKVKEEHIKVREVE